MISQIDRAWAAGFFEGEGSFYPNWNKLRRDGTNTFRTHASLSQKDKGLLERFQRAVGGLGGITKHGGTTGVFQWKTNRFGQAGIVLEILRPWLSQRRLGRAEQLIAEENAQVFRWGNFHRRTL